MHIFLPMHMNPYSGYSAMMIICMTGNFIILHLNLHGAIRIIIIQMCGRLRLLMKFTMFQLPIPPHTLQKQERWKNMPGISDWYTVNLNYGNTSPTRVEPAAPIKQVLALHNG